MADIFNMDDTWNAGATTFTAIKMNVTDTASASGSLLMDLQVGGSNIFSASKNGNIVATGSSSGFVARLTTGNIGGAALGALGVLELGSGSAARDVILTRDAANTLAQRNGTNAQLFRLYNTYTDASNYERANLVWSGNTFFIQTARAGTGTVRDIHLYSGARIIFSPNGTQRWEMEATVAGSLLASTDNTSDIGASGANRPRTGYFGTSVITPILTTITTTVGALGAATTAGQHKFVTDALTPVFGSTVAGGGAVGVPVYADGTNWIVG